MLPRDQRLRRSRDFARVRRFGRPAHCPLVALYVLRRRSPEIRVGFSVSKRVGKATVRNRVKRLLRESVRRQLPGLKAGQDLVFIARPAAAGASYSGIDEAVAYLLRRSGAAHSAARSAHNA